MNLDVREVGSGRSALARAVTCWLVAVALGLLALLPGCNGCRGSATSTAAKKKKEQEDLKKKKEKAKPDFEWTRLKTFPDDPSTVTNYVKPGHWVSARQQFVANNFNFNGDIESATVDGDDKRLDVERTRFQLSGSRKIQLPKGTSKDTELIYQVPRGMVMETGNTKNIWLQTRLLTARGGREVIPPIREGTVAMPDFQFYFVVLAKDPDSYGYWKKLESVAAPRNEGSVGTRLYYRVVLPQLDAASDSAIPLSGNPLTWTNLAYLLWDEIQPASITLDQQQAILDWLHWGGQILISGPNSLDLLKGSFLADYLPAEKVRAVELTQNDFEELNTGWSVACQRTKDARRLDLVGQPILCAQLAKHPDASFVPGTGNLLIERRVGRGRIAVTAFPLNDRRIVNWKSLDNFVNACLLRRPSRRFVPYDNNTIVHQTWTDFEEERHLEEDPRLNSMLRYFTRDVGYLDAKAEETLFASMAPKIRADRSNPLATAMLGGVPESPVPIPGKHPSATDWHFDGHSFTPESGVAGWNDFSAAADESRRALTRAAGIRIPQPSFVLRVVSLYLVVLVPVNWLFFRLLGRVELAWVAAPLIAIFGAVGVVRIAQLDIGFIRSRTEIGVLELYGGFPRGHLTRYSALYSSLSTAYDLGFEDPSALAIPFAVDAGYRRQLHESATQVHFRNETRTAGDRRLTGELSGFQVRSNSTGMVHSEHMLSVGGGLKLINENGPNAELRNGSEIAIQSAGILRVLPSGAAEIAWIGDLPALATVPVRFQPRPPDWNYFAEWANHRATVRTDEELSGEINLAGMFELAIRRLRLSPGDVRLIGWTEEGLAGIEFRPVAAQTAFRAMVLCHLAMGPIPAPKPDINCSLEVRDPPPEEDADDPNNPAESAGTPSPTGSSPGKR
ncbi:MAG: hypothetical protein FJ295_21115 [Planctomycetes bacterium]|nr:hypothetical protein [Planctomycetota bacterium]